MTPERWQRLKGLFGAALERSGEQRTSFLEESCAGDSTLLAEIQRLLRSHESPGNFLGSPTIDRPKEPAHPAPPAPTPGRIGPYEIFREIEHGGMGTVYLAARPDEDYRRLVAIKIIRSGMNIDSVISRFRTEREILAGLVHPKIAPLLDGGTTGDGLPYFVMEYIEGQPIDRYCNARQLSAWQRLDLFLSVCSAVAYAHGKLIVHRDLKPNNILVTPEGIPKLLDFGVAKLVDPAAGAFHQTSPQMRFFTPAFASPEQIRGEPITAMTDVYSLGVLLFVLLTGHRPYGTEASSFADLARAVCQDEPPKPSAAVLVEPSGAEGSIPAGAAGIFCGEPREALSRRLAGDLDSIVLKAMRKDPAQRYGSVDELAEDILRYLQGRPIIARTRTFWSWATKFVSRYRGIRRKGYLTPKRSRSQARAMLHSR